MADGSTAYGISMDEYTAPTIQKLLQMDYIAGIEMASANYIDSRAEILDFSKLVMYSRFYKKFNESIYVELCKSEMVRTWNRANPASIIAEDRQLNEEAVKKIINGSPENMKTIKAIIMSPLKQMINNDAGLLPGEKNVQLLFSEKLLSSLNPIVWFVLLQFYEQKDYFKIIHYICEAISSFLKKNSIPEYFALMFMELLALTENTKLKTYAQKELGKSYNMDQILADDSIRKMLLVKTKNDFMYVSWKIKSFHTNQTSGVEQMEVTIYNRDSKYRALKEKIDVKKDLNLKEKSLTEFYTQSQDGPGNELGLFYISYLDEACRKVDMRFESNVSFIGHDDLTVITLRMYI